MSLVLRGLPDDRCQCPHWGVVTSGSMSVHYRRPRRDREHRRRLLHAARPRTDLRGRTRQLIMFSPTEELKATNEAIERNLQALQGT